MSNWAEPFRARLQLLTDLLPVVAREPRFALKGGTAINLFEHDLPRLSVDVDLTWLPVRDFESDRRDITAALEAIADTLRRPPLRLHVARSAPPGTTEATRLIASRPGARVQIETTPVMRGTVHPVRTMSVQPRVQAEFGFAQMQVLDFADLYAGKLAAALSRQHPRDWFDVGLLLGGGRLDERLWRTFLVYLTASPKPTADMLDPGEPRDFATAFRTQFDGMTANATTVDALLDTRARFLAALPGGIDAAARAFLWSIEDERPDFTLIRLSQAAELPAIRRKLQNLAQRGAAKRAADRQRLAAVLDAIAAR